MRFVDTASLAIYLGISTRDVRRKVASGELKPLGQWGRGSRRGRPGWFFDLDALGEELDDHPTVADIGS